MADETTTEAKTLTSVFNWQNAKMIARKAMHYSMYGMIAYMAFGAFSAAQAGAGTTMGTAPLTNAIVQAGFMIAAGFVGGFMALPMLWDAGVNMVTSVADVFNGTTGIGDALYQNFVPDQEAMTMQSMHPPGWMAGHDMPGMDHSMTHHDIAGNAPFAHDHTGGVQTVSADAGHAGHGCTPSNPDHMNKFAEFSAGLGDQFDRTMQKAEALHGGMWGLFKNQGMHLCR